MRNLRGSSCESLKYQPPMLIGFAVGLNNSIASSNGRSVCVSASLMTTSLNGRKLAWPGGGYWGKGTMVGFALGKAPSETPLWWVPKGRGTILVKPTERNKPID